MIPAAIYSAVVVPVDTESGPLSIQFGPPTKNSPFSAALSFEIISGPYSGQRITAFLYFGSKAGAKSGKTGMERSLESLRICGFTGDDLDKFSDQHPDQEVSITVVHDTYQDEKTGESKTNAKVAWINSPMRGFVLKEALPQTELRRYSAQLKGTLKKIAPVSGRKAERQPATPMAAGSNGADDDPMPPWSGNDEPDPPPMDDPFA